MKRTLTTLFSLTLLFSAIAGISPVSADPGEIQHKDYLTYEGDGWRAGVVDIPTGVDQTITDYGDTTIVDNSPSDTGFGVTWDLD